MEALKLFAPGMHIYNMKHFIFLWIVLPVWAGTAHAQWQKTVHQAFLLPDSLQTLTLDLPWSYTVSSWINNGVMVETSILLENASETVLQTALKEGRYTLRTDTLDNQMLRLRPAPEDFPPMISSKGKVREIIQLRIFIPEIFTQEQDNRWVRKKEEE